MSFPPSLCLCLPGKLALSPNFHFVIVSNRLMLDMLNLWKIQGVSSFLTLHFLPCSCLRALIQKRWSKPHVFPCLKKKRNMVRVFVLFLKVQCIRICILFASNLVIFSSNVATNTECSVQLLIYSSALLQMLRVHRIWCSNHEESLSFFPSWMQMDDPYFF